MSDSNYAKWWETISVCSEGMFRAMIYLATLLTILLALQRQGVEQVPIGYRIVTILGIFFVFNPLINTMIGWKKEKKS